LTVGEVGSDEDIEKLNNAQDLTGLTLQNPGRIQQYSTKGPDANVGGMLVGLRDWFSYFVGNMDTWGGLGTQTDTVGQEQQLAAMASQKISAMQYRSSEFVQNVIESIAFWCLTDADLSEYAEFSVAPGTRPIASALTADSMIGSVEQYLKGFSIDPYSMAFESPQQKWNKAVTVLQGVAMPLMEAFVANGGSLNPREIMEMAALYLNIPELREWFNWSTPTRPGIGSGDLFKGGRKPAQTSRTYRRVNVSGATRGGRDRAEMAAMGGRKIQGSELEAGMRSAMGA